jgi:hypothetical protein
MNAAIRIVYAAAALALVAALRVLALIGLDRALLALVVRGAHWPRAVGELLKTPGRAA